MRPLLRNTAKVMAAVPLMCFQEDSVEPRIVVTMTHYVHAEYGA